MYNHLCNQISQQQMTERSCMEETRCYKVTFVQYYYSFKLAHATNFTKLQ